MIYYRILEDTVNVVKSTEKFGLYRKWVNTFGKFCYF